MSDAPQPQIEQPNKQASYKAGGGLVVQSLPDEIGVPVRKDDFLTLCEGDINQARESRNLCIGISCTAFVGLVGVMAAVDWDTILKAGHLKVALLLALFVVLLMGTAASAVGACIHHSNMKRTLEDSPYSRVRNRLLKEYEAQHSSQVSDSEPKFPRLDALAALGKEEKHLRDLL